MVYLSHSSNMRLKPRVILGRNVCQVRQARTMTQDELAEHADIDRRYVQRIEAGTANPGIDVMSRIRDALGCTWNELTKGI